MKSIVQRLFTAWIALGVAHAAEHEVFVLVKRANNQPLAFQFDAAGQSLLATLPANPLSWQRVNLDGLIADANWVRAAPNTPPSGPRWNTDQLTDLLKGFIEHRNVPIFNLEITQDGHLSPESIAVFREAAARLNSD